MLVDVILPRRHGRAVRRLDKVNGVEVPGEQAHGTTGGSASVSGRRAAVRKSATSFANGTGRKRIGKI